MEGFEKFKSHLKQHQEGMLLFLDQAENEANSVGSKQLLELIKHEKVKIAKSLSSLSAESVELHLSIQKTLQEKTKQLEREIDKLNKTKDALVSDNLLLEYKKKDLLQLTDKLEEANEAISIKNKELVLQEQHIREQANRLNEINEAILEQHQELQRQKEALQDQSDYLHEANQTITSMHEEVQKQKEEILKKNEELLNLNNEKNNLIGIVAHDLKSPLNQMKGLLSIVKMSAATFDKETLACLDMMEKSAERLTGLIAKILDVEAIEANQMNLSFEQFNLSELVLSVVERFRHTAIAKFIPLHTTIQPEVFVFADRMYATQVLDNLISNAIKFSPPYKNIYISISVQENGELVFQVRDEGPGLTDSDKKKLFGKYQKLSARPTGNESSSGLGLSIVKKFVEAMHGKIWCESEFGQGASFFVTLPSKER